MHNNSSGMKRIMQIALLSSAGALLMLFQLPYPGAVWLKFDLSDVPALIGGCALGPWAGFSIILLKNLIFALLRFSPEEMIGLPMNIIANGTFVLVSAFLYHRNKSRQNARFSLLMGVLALTIVMIPANYFILPIFIKLFSPNVPIQSSQQLILAILFFNVPFNIIKGLINSFVTLLIYKRVATFIRPEGEFEWAKKRDIPAKL